MILQRGWAWLGASVLLAGCAINANPPLLFGDHTTYGLHLGTDPASAGGSVALGFKARSLAVVPVSVLQPDGRAEAIRGKENLGGDGAYPDADALSVFAVFASTAHEGGTAPEGHVRLGQVFATGVAAQTLTRGYQCRQSPDAAACLAPAPAASAALAGPPRKVRQAEDAPRKVPGENAAPAGGAAAAAEGSQPYQSPLVFARTDVVGIDIGGSIAEQGLRFVLGYDVNNIALIPAAAKNANGHMSSLFGEGHARSDAYSVLGQFRSDTATKGLNLGLERYFATGIAARNLAAGFAAAIAASAPTP